MRAERSTRTEGSARSEEVAAERLAASGMTFAAWPATGSTIIIPAAELPRLKILVPHEWLLPCVSRCVKDISRVFTMQVLLWRRGATSLVESVEALTDKVDQRAEARFDKLNQR